ncbi:hypothetical protein [Leptonema illini]|uniref:Uncharacterized protein n=1 Tax=Leptonema illini DSM 21528 TaxID=929563 RepID=H2CDB7_9LEPT|nr:hypothetical protein [Leptonema illini]EHQ05421.1 hypothetical protein Lepil_0719 [Leptonema illini DSM 21528]
MPAIELEKIPVLTGPEAYKFIKAAMNPAPIQVTAQQRKIYAAMKPKG